MAVLRLSNIPYDLHWENPPPQWFIKNDSILNMVAGRHTDLFIDPNGKTVTTSSHHLLFQPTEDFLLSARVTVDFGSRFDAGVLLVYAHERQWAKLCFELSPQRKPTIVSVVTRDTSDDCNSMTIENNEIYLRIAKIENTFALHMSYDGQLWSLIRYFTLGALGDFRAGFSAQSPTGESCPVVFDNIQYEARQLADLRSGE